MTQLERKEKILQEIQKNEFPNLAFLYEQESLRLFPEILQELLIEEKEKFQKIISTPKEELKFNDFQYFDELKYLFMLLNHIDMVDKSEITEKIIEDFEPLYTDFSNEMTFSLPYYERICYVLENETLDSEQIRILELEKKNFELA
jgi:Zn-dependent oligopeptidase